MPIESSLKEGHYAEIIHTDNPATPINPFSSDIYSSTKKNKSKDFEQIML